MPPLTLLSCGVESESRLPRSTQWELWAEWADCVYGSAKLLALFPGFQAKGIVLGADARAKAQEALEASRNGKRVLILGSGDVLFHGIGGTLYDLAGDEDELCFIPAETAFQTLFHRLGLPWDKARVFSAHATENIPLGEILSCPLAVVYGGTRLTAARLAQRCVEFLPSCAGRHAILAENLGTPDERICAASLHELSGQECSPTSMLLLLPTGDARMAPTLPLGSDNARFAKENNLITGEEVRAIALSKLRLPAWGVLWDVGAGSGSVGLEAAALRPGLRVHGVEKNESRLELILANQQQMALPNYTLHAGAASEALADLPRPDRIFIGGGGDNLEVILDACFEALAPWGIIVATSVTLESTHKLRNWHPEYRTGCQEISIAEECRIAGKYHHFQQQHRITLVTFSKP
ncbi:precorrin-6Y C5,15-methyltransferase (decarboxylating) subunit CbiT [Akkermansia sp. N21116]|uniref:precorrin-6Y C5,15-methyltransferase (decarboxylating) subunit CbiT n=1 Tax=Akkermansia sp. N21116 TaxID=3040764 RepID=UPI00244EBCBC|nr:precorrin-6Y C5,15-methyltransferase (decarboxylating) subunit CbiT [Akkermansia sp. N21116]WPX40182.1 precorrin-6Y C5,15-methyltransferase (decarboxylating) subunit CbiT [Akkermansia sp. N21116]